MEKQDKKGVVIGATSGDTGPAAMVNVANDNISVHILYPLNGTSQTQENQMLYYTNTNSKSYTLVNKTFDNCQDYVKEILNDKVFIEKMEKENKVIFSINSINWLYSLFIK